MKKILKSKGFKIFGVLLIIFIFGITLFKIAFYETYVMVNIKNNTCDEVNGLKVLYVESEKNIDIPYIPSKGSYQLKFQNKKVNDSEPLFLHYVDKNNVEKKVTLVGYIERGYSGEIEVNINSINTDGELDMKVNSNVKIDM